MAGLGIALISAHTIAAEIADGRLGDSRRRGSPHRAAMVRRASRRPAAVPGRASAFQEFARPARRASSCRKPVNRLQIGQHCCLIWRGGCKAPVMIIVT